MTAGLDPADLALAFFDASPEMFCILDHEGRILRANPAWQEVLGMAERAGGRLVDRVPEDQRLFIERQINIFEGGVWAGPILNAAGRVERFALSWRGDARGFVHVVARKVAAVEDAPQEAARRARALVRHTDLGVVEMTGTGEIIDWNPAAEAIFGYSAAEAIGQNNERLLSPPDHTPDSASLAEQLMRHGVARYVGPNITRDGRRITGAWQVVLLRDEHGAPIGLTAVVQDITEVEAQRSALEERTRLLAEHVEELERQRDTIRALSTPILQVWEGVLALPVIGRLDGARAEAIMDALLAEIVRTGARYAILDVTGVEEVDTGTVHHVARLLRAVALLGSQGILTGVRPAVAQSLVELGSDLPEVPTLSNLRAGLQRCIQGILRGG